MDYEFAKNELYRIYKECFMSKRRANKRSIDDLVVGNGFLSDAAFDVNKLRKNIDNITGVIDFFYTEEPFSGVAFVDCGTVAYDNGELRAYVDEDAEMLTQLGTAIGELSILQKPGDFDAEGTLFAVRGETTIKDINRVYAK